MNNRERKAIILSLTLAAAIIITALALKSGGSEKIAEESESTQVTQENRLTEVERLQVRWVEKLDGKTYITFENGLKTSISDDAAMRDLIKSGVTLRIWYIETDGLPQIERFEFLITPPSCDCQDPQRK